MSTVLFEDSDDSIQAVPEGKVNILGGHSIGHSKQKLYMYMCPMPNSFRDKAISLYRSKIVDKKEILRTVSNTGIYYSSDRILTFPPGTSCISDRDAVSSSGCRGCFPASLNILVLRYQVPQYG
jgi:hypothetical protein